MLGPFWMIDGRAPALFQPVILLNLYGSVPRDMQRLAKMTRTPVGDTVDCSV